MTEPRYGREAARPEALLEYLSEHRQRVGRDREPNRRAWVRGRKTALLGIVAAVALAAAGVLLWRTFDHGGAASRRAAETLSGRAASKSTSTSTSTGAAGAPAARKLPKKAVAQAAHGSAGEAWHRGLRGWRGLTQQGLPDLYYGSMQSTVACSGPRAHGCWKVTVASRHGCPHGVVVIAAESRDGREVGATEGFSGPLAAKRSVVIELDAHRAHGSGRISSLTCAPGKS